MLHEEESVIKNAPRGFFLKASQIHPDHQGNTYLIGFVRVSDDFGRVTDKEHNDDATKKSSHSFVPPVPGGECVVDLTVPVFIF